MHPRSASGPQEHSRIMGLTTRSSWSNASGSKIGSTAKWYAKCLMAYLWCSHASCKPGIRRIRAVPFQARLRLHRAYFDGTKRAIAYDFDGLHQETMRPDFWLARTHDDRYSLTPCSPLGKREYPDIQLGVSLGSFRMLTSDEAEFLVEAFGLHFKVKRLDYSSARPQTQYEPVEVIDTRYVPDPDPLPPQPSRLFKSKTDQSKLIARSLCNVKRKRRTYQALSHLLQPL